MLAVLSFGTYNLIKNIYPNFNVDKENISDDIDNNASNHNNNAVSDSSNSIEVTDSKINLITDKKIKEQEESIKNLTKQLIDIRNQATQQNYNSNGNKCAKTIDIPVINLDDIKVTNVKNHKNVAIFFVEYNSDTGKFPVLAYIMDYRHLQYDYWFEEEIVYVAPFYIAYDFKCDRILYNSNSFDSISTSWVESNRYDDNKYKDVFVGQNEQTEQSIIHKIDEHIRSHTMVYDESKH